MIDTLGPVPIICTANVLLPEMVCMIFPTGASYEALNGLDPNNNKFIIVEGKEQAFASMSNDDIQKMNALECTIVNKTSFPDSSTRFVIKADKRIVLDNVYTSIAADSTMRCIKKAEYRYFEFLDSGNKIIDDTLRKALMDSFSEFCSDVRDLPQEKISMVNDEHNLATCCDLIVNFLDMSDENKRAYLKIKGLKELVTFVCGQIEQYLVSVKLEQEVKADAKASIERNQKQYILNEQMKAIQKEISKLYQGGDSGTSNSDNGEEGDDELTAFRKRVDESDMPKEVADKCRSEIKKLSQQPPLSVESGIVRSYIETLLNMPWSKKLPLKKDLVLAEKVLNKDHFGLDKVKERILEYLAVQSRADRLHAPIICLVGPPGVGKTSLGQSIAEATGRKYVRIALGGMRDEAEIRGHRRTYIGAMPGKIISKLIKCGVRNPLFLLDEIDKVSSDSIHGDPASALLEVLDPEQNKAFSDNYAEVDFDLSDVMFMATANTLDIPPALLDRMEIIELSSYTEDEKFHIAKQHLLPKQLESNGVKKDELTISDGAIISLIRNYTREAGVRSLEREIGRICRKSVKNILLSKGKIKSVKVESSDLPELLGPHVFEAAKSLHKNRVGIVNGLAYTSVGGEVLTIEAVKIPGRGKEIFTGKLGDVMKESISAAVTVVRARAVELGIDPGFMEKCDLHIHCPEGAVPKDGPSAGIAMCTAIMSAVSGNPVRGDVAMTGEITLRGNVLPIGGLREKLLAAAQQGITKVLIPLENVKDLKEVPEIAKTKLKIVPVSFIEEVFSEALVNPLASSAFKSAVVQGEQEKEAMEQKAVKENNLLEEEEKTLNSQATENNLSKPKAEKRVSSKAVKTAVKKVSVIKKKKNSAAVDKTEPKTESKAESKTKKSKKKGKINPVEK